MQSYQGYFCMIAVRICIFAPSGYICEVLVNHRDQNKNIYQKSTSNEIWKLLRS